MARIKVEDVVDHLDREFRGALKDTMQEMFPELEFDERELFRTFKKKVYRKCSIWESVPDHYVKKD
ncbi:MAG: hypothetical protein ACLP9S_17365 [Syntrophales bacterium]